MNKKKLIELRCKAWGITEDEYYCNQCSDFSLEDMARAYRRGKNKGRADLVNKIRFMGKQIDNLKAIVKYDQFTKAKTLLKDIVDTPMYNQMGGEMYENEEYKELIAEAEQFLKECK